jgi:putative addiction module component (TIGR02574 family)
MIPDSPGYSELSTEEQIKYIQALWERVFEHGEDTPVLESHLDLAAERLADYRRDPSQARPAFEVLDEIADRLRNR